MLYYTIQTMENISNKLLSLDIMDENGIPIMTSLIKAVFVIIILFIMCHLTINFMSYTLKINNSSYSNNNVTVQQEILPIQFAESIKQIKSETQDVLPLIPPIPLIQPMPPVQQMPTVSSISVVNDVIKQENLECEWKMDKTKQNYKKGESVYLPSSLDDKLGYIGRDFICYRHSMKDQDYISKRGGCMACTVDLTNDGKNIDAITGTNILSTCVYGHDSDVLLDDKIWSRKKCETMCQSMPDKIA